MISASRIKSVDFYRKIPRDLTEASLSGAGLSIIAALSTMFLFGMELSNYLTVSTSTSIIVDKSSDGDFLRIDFNIRTLTGELLGLSASLVSILLALLQLRFQSAKHSPFETHRLHFIAFFIVILIFTVLLRIGIKLEAAASGCPEILSTVCLFIGYLSLIPLLLIIEPFIGWTVFIVWFFFLVKWACESYEEMRNSIVSAVERATSSLQTLFNRNRNQEGEANISTNV